MEHITLASGGSYFRSPGAATAAAISSLREGHTTYGPTEGTVGLRTALAKRYQNEGIEASPAQILITPGTKQALFNLFTVLLQEGDEVVIPTPAWFGFHELMKYSKGSIKTIETKLLDSYKLTPEALQEILSERSRILLLTNPGNPTGKVYSKEELEAILQITNQYPNLYIISDEIYDFVTYGRPVTSLLSCEGASAERTILLNGFSKSFAMSGWRVGYILGPEPVVKKCMDFQGSTFSGVSIFVQDAAEATIKNPDKALAPMLKVLQENRTIMQQALAAIPKVKFYVPDGAYYFFPDFSHYLGSNKTTGKTLNTSIELCQHLSQDFKLDLVPGDYFGGAGHARMSFAVEQPKLQEAMQRLQQALGQLTH
ncbi:pyridoxal phosphate-dependent aminotransferase [Pontibacter harenae]|uniref:pyridoxal phosphate-dependent aminotransferase n=1 Tax=Pontibacter harenae TaxID=2894083 RepID=UPI001E608AD5|nr:aminotransferase class I/II-fold pyridoxal phosphate-dependent enzyme [Pontibacter harenae]MCC9165559.1 aminotransferase class I/II-fold pyridoxal phosphate-dependent enzyme [Pontibacter harenae]